MEGLISSAVRFIKSSVISKLIADKLSMYWCYAFDSVSPIANKTTVKRYSPISYLDT